ncbi:mannose-6-phosphate isomerase, class I [Alkalicoccus daliensis]|uniref:Mannose-6-phosphate isomerase n=1 Tax=Alkalicoccus daliensis TaxID=745820 RepID=A0A1H0JPW6_9BACI|nr:mannose-6-phosphate isomerase, class I [Alkalicoccus daliensis]SDO45421.1 mannose-6-phosphate isomerase, type 1 [Alkalicoccus daliensis]
MNTILKLAPIFKEKIWGGKNLASQFHYNIPSDQTGECWGISGHENGSNKVEDGRWKGKTLRELWKGEPQLFGLSSQDEFPLLVKIIDAQDDLSIQVHPDDEYAKQKEDYAYGKTECWYIVSAEPGAELVLGHHAETKAELEAYVEKEQWKELFRTVPVQAGDFIYVPSGTVHAIGAGIVLLEVQQSSDITYRFYDYDRPGQDGKMRELHIEDSIACTMVPHEDAAPPRKEWEEGDGKIEELIDNPYFSVKSCRVNGSMLLRKRAPYQLVTVLEGEGEALVNEETRHVVKGDHLLIPADTASVKWTGDLHFIVAEPGEEA